MNSQRRQERKRSGIISINDIRVYAYHGCLKEEATIGGNYRVDLKIHADFSKAAEKDDLRLTIDYCNVYEIVKREMKTRSKLIEHAALRIAEAVKKTFPGIEEVRVRLTKIAPPVNGDMGSVSVIISR